MHIPPDSDEREVFSSLIADMIEVALVDRVGATPVPDTKPRTSVTEVSNTVKSLSSNFKSMAV